MKLWAVIDCNGRMWIGSIRKTRRESIDAIASQKWRWDQLKQVGYRCKRITVTVEGET